jgi:hypothetical protein
VNVTVVQRARAPVGEELLDREDPRRGLVHPSVRSFLIARTHDASASSSCSSISASSSNSCLTAAARSCSKTAHGELVGVELAARRRLAAKMRRLRGLTIRRRLRSDRRADHRPRIEDSVRPMVERLPMNG